MIFSILIFTAYIFCIMVADSDSLNHSCLLNDISHTSHSFQFNFSGLDHIVNLLWNFALEF